MKFDVGTAGFVLSLIAIALFVMEYMAADPYKRRISRLEYSLKSFCAGVPRLESCAEMDLPLHLEKFED